MSPDPALGSSLFAGPDRRASHRYPVSMELTYRERKGDQAGTGRTLDMSSRGLCCSGLEPLPAGTEIEVSLDWPVLLEDCPLKMVIVGHVLRSGAGRTALLILRYQFHTRKRHVSVERGHSTQTLQVA